MEATTQARKATLNDLLDRALNKGLMLRADVVIAMAGVPLVGVSLHAAIAGMETMLEYGMLVDWDEAIRSERLEKMEALRSGPLCGEAPRIKMPAAVWNDGGPGPAWKWGILYLTPSRLILHHATFDKVMAEIEISQIAELTRPNGNQLKIRTKDADTTLLRAVGIDKISNLLPEACPSCGMLAPEEVLLEEGCPKCAWVSARKRSALSIAAT